MIRSAFVATVLILSVSASNYNRNGRIVGGMEAVEGQFPYMASLRVKRFLEHSCGSAILNERWLVSAAHCTANYREDELYITVGLLKRGSGGVSHDIEKIINHDYDPMNFKNDICTIKVVGKIVFTPSIQPIQLASEFTPGGMASLVSGWGLIGQQAGLAPHLMWLRKTTLSKEDCKKVYGNLVDDSILCAVGGGVGQGICSSDSGGPLTANGLLIGVVNFGLPCGSGNPEGYARVSYYRQWIIENSVL